MEFTSNKYVCNSTVVPNPTEYTKIDKYDTKIKKSKLVQNWSLVPKLTKSIRYVSSCLIDAWKAHPSSPKVSRRAVPKSQSFRAWPGGEE